MTKAQLKSWLHQNNISFLQHQLKSYYIKLVKENSVYLPHVVCDFKVLNPFVNYVQKI